MKHIALSLLLMVSVGCIDPFDPSWYPREA
jgi:hypothetical protein